MLQQSWFSFGVWRIVGGAPSQDLYYVNLFSMALFGAQHITARVIVVRGFCLKDMFIDFC